MQSTTLTKMEMPDLRVTLRQHRLPPPDTFLSNFITWSSNAV